MARRFPSPGQSVIVKMLNSNTPNGAGSLTGVGSTGLEAGENAGAGFVVGVDNGVDPTTDSLIDPGVGSEIRILGIPGNQTTGQQRVPVIMTSLRDGTVGTTVRACQMYNILNSNPVYSLEQPGCLADDSGRRRRRIHLHRRQFADGIRSDQSLRRQPHR